MTRKRNFDVTVESDDGNNFTFSGESCTVKRKSFLTRLGMTKDVKETIDCKTAKTKQK